MKPLELTVFEKEPGLYGREDTYNSPDGFWAYPESHVDGYAAEKRFTDAELAAEYWEHRYGNEVASGWASDYSIIKQSRERLEVIGRFATLPHYDQEEDHT